MLFQKNALWRAQYNYCTTVSWLSIYWKLKTGETRNIQYQHSSFAKINYQLHLKRQETHIDKQSMGNQMKGGVSSFDKWRQKNTSQLVPHKLTGMLTSSFISDGVPIHHHWQTDIASQSTHLTSLLDCLTAVSACVRLKTPLLQDTGVCVRWWKTKRPWESMASHLG